MSCRDFAGFFVEVAKDVFSHTCTLNCASVHKNRPANTHYRVLNRERTVFRMEKSMKLLNIDKPLLFQWGSKV